MYHIYHTEGIILASTATGESDRFFQILTPDLGLIPAVARGSRALVSKLKYHLSDHAHIQLDLVRGKEVWTITGVMPTDDGVPELTVSPYVMMLASFVKRLVHGQEPSHELFATMVAAWRLLAAVPQSIASDSTVHDVTYNAVSGMASDAIVLAAKLYILAFLGYASNVSVLARVGDTPFCAETVMIVTANKGVATREVARSLAETHL
jgi:recombinational DNA repair protein (RecF pathway)